jgi:hypothetical protein
MRSIGAPFRKPVSAGRFDCLVLGVIGSPVLLLSDELKSELDTALHSLFEDYQRTRENLATTAASQSSKNNAK